MECCSLPSTNGSGGVRAHFDALRQEIAELESLSAPLHAERQRLLAQIQPLEEQVRAIEQQIRDLEQPQLGEMKNALSSLAKTLGARSIRVG